MDPRGQLQPQLRQDEQLLWQGGPDPLVRFSRIDAILLYLVVAYTTGVAFLWYVAPRHAGSAGSAVAALYTAVWLYWPLGRFIYRLYAKSRTAYAVTSTRALIVGPQRSREMPLRDAPV